jgi:hypothetical protein
MSKSSLATGAPASSNIAHCVERYFVATGHGGGWLVFREGNSHAIHRLPGKRQALHTAKIMARSNSPSQVLVEDHRGTFALAYDFDHTNDVRGY